MVSFTKKQFSHLLLITAATCFLLNADILVSSGLHFRRILLKDTEKYGEILPDGTLFIPIGKERGRSKGQNLLERVKGTRSLMCKDLLADLDEKKLTRLHVETALCGDFSIGNMMTTLLSYNLAAHLAGLPFTFSCANSKPGIMSTMQKVEKAPLPILDDYNLEKFCTGSRMSDMAYGHYFVVDAIRNQIVQSQNLVSEGDDAVIHVRLHDAFDPITRTQSQRGLFQHVAYSNMLKKAEQEKGEIQSISIVTQTFVEKELDRDRDRIYAHRSEVAGRDLATHLGQEFPNAVVSIHNDRKSETTVTSYARLVLAKKIAICGCSTFCALPVSSVQEGVMAYLLDSKYLNGFYTQYLAKNHDNIHLWKAPMLGGNEMKDLADAEVLDFLRDKNTTGIEI